MCFSAEASFTASAIIGGMGIITTKKSLPKQKIFGMIPLLFAVQQLFEGTIWLGFDNPHYAGLRSISTMIFLTFAWAIWPMIIPYAMYRMEEHDTRKKILGVLSFIGLIAGLCSMYPIFISHPEPYIASFHIDYSLLENPPHGILVDVYEIVYLLCTLVTMLISSQRLMYVYGIANIIGLVIAGVFYQSSVPSTWCFFSAILSALIYWILEKNQSSKLGAS